MGQNFADYPGTSPEQPFYTILHATVFYIKQGIPFKKKS